MPRMRTIRQCYFELRKNDPGCCIGLAWLYGQVKSNKLPHTRAGKRILIDMDRLEYLLANPAQFEQRKPEINRGGYRMDNR